MEKLEKILASAQQALSFERLEAYRIRGSFNTLEEALGAYSWNVALSQSLYSSLQLLEISLRNTLDRAITCDRQSSFWFDDPTLISRAHERQAIQSAKANLLRWHKPIEPGRVIAELHFGFWDSLFDVHYEYEQKLWPRLLKPAFPFAPRRFRERAVLSKHLSQIRLLRNRVFHYEPVWYWRNLADIHTSTIEMISWIEPVLATYAKAIDQFSTVVQRGLSFYQRATAGYFLPPKEIVNVTANHKQPLVENI